MEVHQVCLVSPLVSSGLLDLYRNSCALVEELAHSHGFLERVNGSYGVANRAISIPVVSKGIYLMMVNVLKISKD